MTPILDQYLCATWDISPLGKISLKVVDNRADRQMERQVNI